MPDFSLRRYAKVAVFTVVLVMMLVMFPAMVSAGDAGKNEGSCCELFGVWVFAPSGDMGSFLPNHRFLWQSRIYVYDCTGPTITFDWEKGEMHDVRRVAPNIIEYRDSSGKTYKAVRKSNKVVVNGKTYRACPTGGN